MNFENISDGGEGGRGVISDLKKVIVIFLDLELKFWLQVLVINLVMFGHI